jgi:predicted Na+-dependent transporter
MMGLGTRLELKAIKSFFRDQSGKCTVFRPLIVGVLFQIFLNPLIGGCIISFFTELDPQHRIAAMMIMCSAGGLGSNFLSYIAWGNLEASVVMTGVSTLAAAVTFPTMTLLNVKVIWNLDDEGTQLPILPFLGSVILILLPVAMGIVIQLRAGEKVMACMGISTVVCGFVLIVMGVLVGVADSEVREAVRMLGSPTLYGLAITLNIAGLAVGYLAGLVSRTTEEYRRTLAFEVGAQNMTLPWGVVTVAFASRERMLYLSMLAVYAVCQACVNMLLASIFCFAFPLKSSKEQNAREEGGAPATPSETSDAKPEDEKTADPVKSGDAVEVDVSEAV